MPDGLSARDARLFQAFKQRFDRLSAQAPTLTLERLCEQIVCAHDYDLAVLAQWDGRRRYANLRKLARLARSYEELRGPDVQGFVRFVAEQDAVGASELEAVAEEEGTDVIRLLTIHSAKGLEFKVVVVADAGRDRGRHDADEILCLPDGRLGFRVAEPSTGKRLSTSEYESVRSAEQDAEGAERLRLYYVAMTRAIDRLIVSGAIDQDRKADANTPIGWVLDRLEASEFDDVGAEPGPMEIERGGARLLIRLDRYAPEALVEGTAAVVEQLELFEVAENGGAAAGGAGLAPLTEVPAPPLHRVRRLSYSALSLFERCSYRYFAERVVGLRPADAMGTVPGQTGLAATEIGDAVHTLLERIDLGAPAVPEDLEAAVRARYPAVTDEELERIRAFVESYCELRAGRASRRARGSHARTARSPSSTTASSCTAASTCSIATGRARSSSTTRRTRSPKPSRRRSSRPTTGSSGSSTRWPASGRARSRWRSSTTSSSGPDAVVSDKLCARRRARARDRALVGDRRGSRPGEFRPTPSEFVCADCPALNSSARGPRLRHGA